MTREHRAARVGGHSPTCAAPTMADVLVVDADLEARERLVTLLEGAGHTVGAVGGGTDALALLSRSAPPRVILLDLEMPEIDGWEVLAWLDARPSLAAVPVVLLSARGPVSLQGAPAAAIAVLRKPPHPVLLLALVAQLARAPPSAH